MRPVKKNLRNERAQGIRPSEIPRVRIPAERIDLIYLDAPLQLQPVHPLRVTWLPKP